MTIPKPLLKKKQFPHHHIQKTQKKKNKHKHPISTNFHNPKNLKHYKIKLLKIPSQLKKFKSYSNFLFHIIYNKQLSYIYINNNKSNIYTY